MTTSPIAIDTRSPDETRLLGRFLGELARPGDLICLVGDLGAGKTCFVQGFAWGTGFDGWASSPSFVLAKEYKGSVTVHHIDFYRLDDVEEIGDLGIRDLLNGEDICIIEWAEKGSGLLPAERLTIRFDHRGENERRLRIEPCGETYASLSRELVEQWNSR